MDAPTYAPATAYKRPEIVARPMNTADTSIARLLADPAAKAILEKEIVAFDLRVGNEALKPQLDNFSPRSLVQFGVFQAVDLDRVDARLRTLPAKTSG